MKDLLGLLLIYEIDSAPIKGDSFFTYGILSVSCIVVGDSESSALGSGDVM